jgi:hypothetical protein
MNSAFTLKHVMQHLTATQHALLIVIPSLVGSDLFLSFTGLDVFPVKTLTFALWLSVVD